MKHFLELIEHRARALQHAVVTVLSIILLCASPLAATSEAPIVIPSRQQAARVNTDTIGVVFTHEELFHQMVHDMEDALEPVSGLRIVPVMGKNHVQSIYDLLYLKGVDLALVRSDAVEYVKRKGDYERIERFVNSVAKLTEERIVLIANRNITAVDQLDGETVAFGVPGSGEYVTGTIAFDTLGITVETVEMEGTLALDQVRDGSIAAMVYLLRAPESIQTGSDLQTALAVSEITASEELHIIPIPQNDVMSELYHPTALGHDDLPGLIREGERVDTYRVDVILAGYRWSADNPRYDKSVRFVNALLDGLEELQGGGFQESWDSVSLPQANPTIEPLPVMQQIVAQRERQALENQQQRAEDNARKAVIERQKTTDELTATRDRLSALLERKLEDAESAELQRLLDELNSIIDPSPGQ